MVLIVLWSFFFISFHDYPQQVIALKTLLEHLTAK